MIFYDLFFVCYSMAACSNSVECRHSALWIPRKRTSLTGTSRSPNTTAPAPYTTGELTFYCTLQINVVNRYLI